MQIPSLLLLSLFFTVVTGSNELSYRSFEDDAESGVTFSRGSRSFQEIIRPGDIGEADRSALRKFLIQCSESNAGVEIDSSEEPSMQCSHRFLAYCLCGGSLTILTLILLILYKSKL